MGDPKGGVTVATWWRLRRPGDARARAWGGRLRVGMLGGRLRARLEARRPSWGAVRRPGPRYAGNLSRQPRLPLA